VGIELLRGANGRVSELRLGDMQRLPALGQNNAQFPPEVLELNLGTSCPYSRPMEGFVDPLIARAGLGIPEDIRTVRKLRNLLDS